MADESRGSSTSTDSWEAFEVEELSERQSVGGDEYLKFLDRGSISAGLYRLGAGATDRQSPHDLDEVYVVLGGRAILEVGAKRISVRKDSIAYVRADEPHRFVDIDEELTVLVVFSKGPVDDENPAWIAVEQNELSTKGKPDENVWHPFVDASSMIFGLYLLPRQLGGDSTLVHEVDEINIVMKGRSRFTMGSDTIDVGPGSVVFVERGTGHHFGDLSEDFEVLILFAKNKD